MMTPLRELQLDMQRHLLGEDSGVTAAIVDAPPLPAAERLNIYRNAYQVRLIDALHDTYPVLHALVGDEVFFELGASFVTAYPSTFRSIRWYGSELAQFMAQNEPYNGQPILAEMAQLEWTLSEVFDAPDAQPLTRAALANLDPAEWSNLRFEFHPALRLLSLQWNTAAAWKAMSADEIPPDPEIAAQPLPWLIWRQDLQNYFRSLSAVEATALNAALRGHTFGEICEALAELLPEEEIPPAAAGLLGGWTDSGIIIALG
jgi:hypothetical protein